MTDDDLYDLRADTPQTFEGWKKAATCEGHDWGIVSMSIDHAGAVDLDYCPRCGVTRRTVVNLTDKAYQEYY